MYEEIKKFFLLIPTFGIEAKLVFSVVLILVTFSALMYIWRPDFYNYHPNKDSSANATGDDTDISYEEQQAYKSVISTIASQLNPDSKVKIKDVIIGEDSKQPHTVDLSISSEVEGRIFLEVIKTIHGDKPVGIRSINNFHAILKDIRASKGIVISNSGFTDEAKHFAPSYGIQLMSLLDAESNNWNDGVSVPVLFEDYTFDVQIHPIMYMEPGYQFFDDFRKWSISVDNSKTKLNLVQWLMSLWNKIDRQTLYSDGAMELDFTERVIVNENNGRRIKPKSFVVKLILKKAAYLKYVTARNYKGLKNELNGNTDLTLAEIETNIDVNDGSWIIISDVEEFISRSRGMLFHIRKSLDNPMDTIENVSPVTFNQL